MQKYLTDASFLKEIDLRKTKEQYVRITILTFAEKPIADIEGNVTAGSINIDGSSSMRRTCNITFVPTQDQIIDYKDINNLLSINKKVKVEIGITNTTKKYPTEPVIWFPQGIYVICGMSISKSTNGFSISLQLKDKMCLLNGDVSGIIPAAVTLNEMDTYNGISAIDEDAYNLIGTIDDVEKLLVTMPSNLLYYDGEQKYALIVDGLSSDAASNAIIQPTI